MSRDSIKKRRKERISHIMKHAKKVFAESGYAMASTNKIAEAAGVSKRSMYYYVGVKEHIYRLIIDGILSEINHNLKRVTTCCDHLPAKDRLYYIISAIAQITKDDEVNSILIREMVSGEEFLPRQAIRELTDGINELFSDIFQQSEQMGTVSNIDPMVLGVMIQAFFLHWKTIARHLPGDSAGNKRISMYAEDITGALVDEVYRIIKMIAVPQTGNQHSRLERAAFEVEKYRKPSQIN